MFKDKKVNVSIIIPCRNEEKFIARCLDSIIANDYPKDRLEALVVDGMSKDETKRIALVLAHPFGSGNAYIKIGSKGPRWTDAAAFGCYKKEIFQKVGLFNENVGSEDMDLNVRLREAGGRILLVPSIVINYYADSDFKAFWKHNFSGCIFR